MNNLLKAILLCPLLSAAGFAAEDAADHPAADGTWSLESGLLWQVGDNTPISYRLVPTQLSWRSPGVLRRDFSDGSMLVIRHRLTLLGAWVQHGPESYYIAWSASPSIEWWNSARTWSVYGGAGGGFGLTDSRGVEGGQGQDFTFNWFARGGVERRIAPSASLNVGVMFMHMSNRGQTDPNPGIDALGFVIGYARAF